MRSVVVMFLARQVYVRLKRGKHALAVLKDEGRPCKPLCESALPRKAAQLPPWKRQMLWAAESLEAAEAVRAIWAIDPSEAGGYSDGSRLGLIFRSWHAETLDPMSSQGIRPRKWPCSL